MAAAWGCAEVFPAPLGRKGRRGGCRSTFQGLSEWGELDLEKYIYALERAVEIPSRGQELGFCVK